MGKRRTQELPSYGVPPDVINVGFRLFGLSIFQMGALLLAGIAGLVTLINFPLEFVIFRVLGATVSFCLVAGFFLMPLPALTAFEQLISYLTYRRAQIPHRTRARPMPPLASQYSNHLVAADSAAVTFRPSQPGALAPVVFEDKVAQPDSDSE